VSAVPTFTISITIRVAGGIAEARTGHRHIRARVLKALEDQIRFEKDTRGVVIIGPDDTLLGKITCLTWADAPDIRGGPAAVLSQEEPA
jgi:hypothetical protein